MLVAKWQRYCNQDYKGITKVKFIYKKLSWTRYDDASNMSSEAVGV